MTEPNLAFSSNVTRHRWTVVRSHRARTAAAYMDNIRAQARGLVTAMNFCRCGVRLGRRSVERGRRDANPCVTRDPLT
jgi:hypothetical protein